MPLIVGIAAIALSAFLVGLIVGYVHANRQWSRAYAIRARAAASAAVPRLAGVDEAAAAGVQQH